MVPRRPPFADKAPGRFHHPPPKAEMAERQLYDDFIEQWADYQRIAARDTRGSLTQQTVDKAREASMRAAGAYLQDRRLIVTAMSVAICLVLDQHPRHPLGVESVAQPGACHARDRGARYRENAGSTFTIRLPCRQTSGLTKLQ
jgi:hypothetical protein